MKFLFSRDIFIIVVVVNIFVNQIMSIAAEQVKSVKVEKKIVKKTTTKNVVKKQKQPIKTNKKTSKKINKKTLNSIIDEIEKKYSENEKKEENNKNKDNNLQNQKQDKLKKNDENEILETYAGMVGDKRASKGITLDLTMEMRGIGCWLLCINGKGVDNKKLVHSDLQLNPTRFLINVNTSNLKDKVVNFTYQMPKNIRLKYGKQKNGYTISIELPSNTKIITKNVSAGEISVKFVNYDIVNDFNKKLEERNKKQQDAVSLKNSVSIMNNLNHKNDVFIFDSKYHGLLELEKDTVFQKIKIKHKKPFIVAIDAGHGGIDPGASGANGVYEKNITLKYAKSLKRELKKHNVKVIMTRTNDETVPLTNRVRIAKQAHADLFISLHMDAHENPKTSGMTVYRLSDINDSHPDWSRFYNRYYLPKQYENYIQDRPILDILVSMTRQTLSEKSSIIIDNILLSFKKNGVCNICRKGQRSFAVLRGLDMMSILIEIGYISNLKEQKKLLLASNIKKITANLANVIVRTFEE